MDIPQLLISRLSLLDSRFSRLETRTSRPSQRKNRVSRIESRLSTYLWAVLYVTAKSGNLAYSINSMHKVHSTILRNNTSHFQLCISIITSLQPSDLLQGSWFAYCSPITVSLKWVDIHVSHLITKKWRQQVYKERYCFIEFNLHLQVNHLWFLTSS